MEDVTPRAPSAGPSDMELVRSDSADAAAAQRSDAPMADAEAARNSAVAPEAGGTENGEEEVYVLLELDALDSRGQLQPGHAIELSGLDTFQPRVKLPDGTVCAASYDETIGSCMLFAIDGGASGGTVSAPTLEYMCSTERLLKVQRPPPQQPP